MSILLENRVFVAGVLGWASAQCLKALLYTIINKSFRPERLVGDGGMPSAHSATVSALACSAGFVYGFDSFEFAISFFFAFIVMHDAMGVRQVTGKQSVVLNELLAAFAAGHPEEMLTETKLKEFVGHTPLQVAAGCIIGLLISCIYCM